MGELESLIKDHAREMGITVTGIAGPGRLDGPPSLDPSYSMPGARSIVSLVAPMDAEAVRDFLSKRSSSAHNLDQTRWNQELMRIGESIAAIIRKKGYRASALPSNSDYRRSPDPWAMHPAFSHRLGAIASGVAGMGWSGNVKTEEYGASVYLGTVVTDAVLKSDPLRFSPRHFIDTYCNSCRKCAKTCVAQMFSPRGEEYVLVNGALHPRGKRASIDLCEIACFGLHSLSQDRLWSTWGLNWIEDWLNSPPGELSAFQARKYMMLAGARAGDSTARFDLIRSIGREAHPREVIDSYLALEPAKRPHSERVALLRDFARNLGAARPDDFRTDLVLTCGNCALVCGPDKIETARRFRLLTQSGIVAPGPSGEPVVVRTYEEAVALREKHLPKVSLLKGVADGAATGLIFHRRFFGLEPKSGIRGLLYSRRLKKAVRNGAPGIRKQD